MGGIRCEPCCAFRSSRGRFRVWKRLSLACAGGGAMREYRIAVIPGDGIGKEVIAAGLEVLTRLQERCGDFCFRETVLPWGSDFYRATGRMMPQHGLELLRGF